jgi:creatinine amidohydrolase
MRIDRLNWPDVAEYLKRDNRLILPVGSVEQHGPAVATGIDYIVPTAVAERAGEEAGVMVAPPLTYGMSLHHAAFAGTLSLRPTVYLSMVIDLFAFAYHQGFRRILVLNGHGGNVPTLKAAAGQASYELEGVRIYIRSYYELPSVVEIIEEELGPGEGSHATPSEVSMLMYLEPELVGDLSAHEKSEPGLITWHPAPSDMEQYYPQGPVGADPDLASPELGKRLFDAAVADVVEILGKM